MLNLTPKKIISLLCDPWFDCVYCKELVTTTIEFKICAVCTDNHENCTQYKNDHNETFLATVCLDCFEKS